METTTIVESNHIYTERELFCLIAEGDEEAFAEFYTRIKTDCSAYAYRILQSQEGVKEILQEALIRLWIYRDKLFDVAQPSAWFFRIVANECTRYLSKYKFKLLAVNEDNDGAGAENVSLNYTELEVSYRETERIIAEMVTALPPKRKEIYLLSREKGLTQQQIAEHLGVSRDYVKKALISAQELIRQKLIEEGIFIPVIIFLLY